MEMEKHIYIYYVQQFLLEPLRLSLIYGNLYYNLSLSFDWRVKKKNDGEIA